MHAPRDQADRTGSDGPSPPRDADAVDLRILATTDLHAQLTARDYLTGRRHPDIGLTRVATLIRAARDEAPNTLLFDNGDTIEGSALADHAAATGRGGAHPVIAAMNALGYDAATLGNHEFSHGLAFLQATIAAAAHPVVSANLMWAADGRPFVPPHVVLDRSVRDRGGQTRRLRIGVFGLTPPQVLVWEAKHIAGRLVARGMVDGAQAAVAALRAEGADLVVALCHTGLTRDRADRDNPGLALATETGADVVVLGHGHQVFPGPDFADLPGADIARGTIAARPVTMPGALGSHLGVVDLVLRRDAGRWHVTDAQAATRPVRPVRPVRPARPVRTARTATARPVAEDTALLAAARPAERRLSRWLAQRAGMTDAPLDSYFALVADGALLRAVAAAKAAWLAGIAPGTALAGLPILGAVAPFRAGGRGGPRNYVDVPAGPLTRRALTELYVHPNSFAAVEMTGAGVADWLERGASGYVRQTPGTTAPLIDPAFPAFAFEPIHGLSYRIDLTAPARFDAQGRLADPAAVRIRDLAWNGRPIDKGQRFAVATNSYRAGLLMQQMGDAVLNRLDRPILSREVLAAWFARPARGDDGPMAPGDGPMAPGDGPMALGGWSFAPMGGHAVLFDTGPGAARHLDRIAALSPEVEGMTPAGFLRLRLRL
jgi:2',3'-cyclic-nucleotide 2'-phosphodiesterase/3'-nucleotidase